MAQLDDEPHGTCPVLIHYRVRPAHGRDHGPLVVDDVADANAVRQGGVLRAVAELDSERLGSFLYRVVQQGDAEGLGLFPLQEGEGLGPGREVRAQAGGGDVVVGSRVAVHRGHVD